QRSDSVHDSSFPKPLSSVPRTIGDVEDCAIASPQRSPICHLQSCAGLRTRLHQPGAKLLNVSAQESSSKWNFIVQGFGSFFPIARKITPRRNRVSLSSFVVFRSRNSAANCRTNLALEIHHD